MASNPLPNVPYRIAIVDQNGILTPEGAAFFRGLYIRVGAANALTNIQLESLSSGTAFQAELDALEGTVANNEFTTLRAFNDLGQGPVL